MFRICEGFQQNITSADVRIELVKEEEIVGT
jgi:hypothetical protein